MKIFSSNKLGHLGEHLAGQIKQSKKSIFEKDLIIVQSPAMAKWLNLKLAEVNGISAQLNFPFLKNFIVDILCKVGFKSEDDLWSQQTLTWRILKALPLVEESSEALANYTKNDLSRRHQLAQQLARLFDEYMAYRPGWLLAWEKGQTANLEHKSKHEEWQALLWRKLVEDDEQSFHKALLDFNRAENLDFNALKLPAEISIFGLSSMPPSFIRFFQVLSEQNDSININFYYLSPCQEYWADLKQSAHCFPRLDQDSIPDFKTSQDSSCPYALLKSWGVLGRDFLNLLIDNTDFDTLEFFEENTSSSSLGKIQNGILNLQDSFTGNALGNDQSITVNSCHNPLRELEVLHDHLRGLLKKNPDLKPRDIIVLCPDVTIYAPYITAVFDDEDVNPNSQLKNSKIPYSISDRSFCNTSQIVNTFLKILHLPQGRLTSNDVLDILENSDLLRQFSLNLADLDTIREWVDSAAIRWGSDADFREALLGLKDFKQNTWEFGFDRLLSGYAFADEELYEGSLSTGVGGDGLVLGRFKNFVDALFSINKELQLKHTTEDWVILLQKIHDDFFYDNYETATERGLILVAIAELEKNWGLSQLSMELPPEIVLKSLGSSLEEQRSSFGFLDKGVTFCTLLPMRSIPSKVVCLLGINEGVFPRLDRRSGFDLMFKNWQQGDRSVRLDDRYIFLESLLSAEDSFYVSYIGQSEKDNSPIPPSIILAELLDFLKSNMPSFAVLEHPLQAYSNRYFTGGLPSFSYKNFTAALAHISHGAEQAPFCKEALSLPDSDDDLREVKLADLIDFYKHPARHFLKKQLNTSLFQEEKSELEVDEAFDSPTGLENYQLSVELHEDLSDIIHNLKAQEPPLSSERLQEEVEESKAALRQRYIASGRFPYGEAGKKTFDKKFDELSEFTIALMNRENNRQEWQTEIDIPVPQLGLRLIGDIERLFGGDYLPFRLGKEAIKHQLPEIIKYLALCSNEHSKTSVQSMIYQSIDNTSQVPISVAAESLQDLNYFLSLYLDGLQKPLPFIPACFEKYQGKIKGNNPEKEQEQGIKAAYTQWAERGFGSPVQPECENEVNKLCFTEQFPGYNPDFQDNFMALLEGVSEIFSKYKWTGEAK